MNMFQLILLVLALVLALCASAGVGHPRVNLLAASFASFVAAALVALVP
jgi:hypothetical protein